MKHSLTIRERLYPNKEQTQLLNDTIFLSNQCYNVCVNEGLKELERNKNLHKEGRTYLQCNAYYHACKAAMKQRNIKWRSKAAMYAIKDYLEARQKCFKSGSCYPNRFRCSTSNEQSFSWDNQTSRPVINEESKRFQYLRIMKQNIKFRDSWDILNLDVKIMKITVKKYNDKFYVHFCIEFEPDLTPITSVEDISDDKIVGIDLNIDNLGLSNKTLVPTMTRQNRALVYGEAIKRLQRKQSRRVLIAKKTKKPLGQNFRKTQRKINKLHEKVKNKKQDTIHKATNSIIEQFDVIFAEDLQVKNMTRRAKLKGVKRKSGLNRSILSVSFYEYLRVLEYKAKLNGKLFVKVPPEYTSKACSNCGCINEDLRLSDRVFICQDCGYEEHRDVNAALNIKHKGLELCA